MRTIEIPLNKNRIILHLIISIIIIFIATTFAYYIYLDGKISLTLTIVLVIGIPYLIYYFLTNLNKIINKKPGLVLDNRGVLDSLGFSEIGIISWENITEAKIIKHNFSEYLIIKVKNNEIIVSKLNGLKKNFTQKYIEIYGGPIVINLQNLKIDKYELIKIIQNKMQS